MQKTYYIVRIIPGICHDVANEVDKKRPSVTSLVSQTSGFDPCACLLAGGCGAWRLLARRRRRRRRRRRHSSILQVDIQTKVRKIQEMLEKLYFGKTPRAIQHVFFAGNFDARLLA